MTWRTTLVALVCRPSRIDFLGKQNHLRGLSMYFCKCGSPLVTTLGDQSTTGQLHRYDQIRLDVRVAQGDSRVFLEFAAHLVPLDC